MRVYYVCTKCNEYLGSVDYYYALTHTHDCPKCGQEMRVRPEVPRPCP